MSVFKFFSSKVRAIGLIEISITLVIVGLLIFGAMKGWKMVESAKLGSTTQQVLQIHTSLESYKQSHYRKPPKDLFWQALEKYGGLPLKGDKNPTSSLGIPFVYEDEKVKLGSLSAQQALHIKNTLDSNSSLDMGWVKVVDEHNAPQKEIDIHEDGKEYKIVVEML